MDIAVHELVSAAVEILRIESPEWCHNFPEDNDESWTSMDSPTASLKLALVHGTFVITWFQNCCHDGEWLFVEPARGEVFPQLTVDADTTPESLAESLKIIEEPLRPFQTRLMAILHARRRRDDMCETCGSNEHHASTCAWDLERESSSRASRECGPN